MSATTRTAKSSALTPWALPFGIIVAWEALSVAGLIPGARYVCLAGVGHLPNLEAPRAFDAAVLDFLQGALTPARA